MFDLTRLHDELEKALKDRDNWEMNGYDTPLLTYHEQLELYQTRLERIGEQVRKALK